MTQGAEQLVSFTIDMMRFEYRFRSTQSGGVEVNAPEFGDEWVNRQLVGDRIEDSLRSSGLFLDSLGRDDRSENEKELSPEELLDKRVGELAEKIVKRLDEAITGA